jgi:hypothetical protein
MVLALLLFAEKPNDMHWRIQSGSIPPPSSAKKERKKNNKGCNKNGVSSTDEQFINNPNLNINWRKLHT